MANDVGKNPELAEYMLAGYPCIHLPTAEYEVAEKRVLDAMLKTGRAEDEFGVWKITTGLIACKAGEWENTKARRKKEDDLLPCLKLMQQGRNDSTSAVYVFHNIRQLMPNPQVIQQLIDSIMDARLEGHNIILVGPYLELPPELRSLITVIDSPLPTQLEIRRQYLKLSDAYADDLSNIPKTKEGKADLIRSAAASAVGLDTIGCENALALSMAVTSGIDIKIIQKQKEQEVRKSDVLEFFSSDETMDNVGGFHALKVWMSRRRRAFSKEAEEYGLSYPKGMLVVGPAGTGKSLVVKAVGHYLGLPLLRLDIGKVFRSLVGESEAAIRMVLQIAEAVSPVILWIDEIDKGLAGATGGGDLDSGVASRVVSTILTWRQECIKPVLLLGTANDVHHLPSMVYRKGRLDEVWATDIPNEEERGEIFSIHIRKRKRDPEDYNIKLLAVRSKGFTGAEIEACIEDAMFSAFDEGVEFTTQHLQVAMTETVPQSVRDSEELEAIREWAATRARMVSSGEAPSTEPKKSKIRQIKPTKKK